MKPSRLATLVVLGALLLSLPAFAGDVYTVFDQPTDGVYLASTTDYGGGDGSGNYISSLGTFDFSYPMEESSVPDSWGTWNCPPATESCTPNVLLTEGGTALTLTLTAPDNTAGFELEPDMFQAETVAASFYNQTGALIATITLNPNGSAGALLFALQDDTPGNWISYIDITDLAGDDFAIAQLRQGNSTSSVPEPGGMSILGMFLLGALGLYRKMR
ncbi:MAG: hypothetical protein ACLQGV_21715 [Bryobacteraceae bacterium]